MLVDKFRMIRMVAISNSEALRKSVKKYDKVVAATEARKQLSAGLLPRLYATALASDGGRSPFDTLREELNLGRGDPSDDGLTSGDDPGAVYADDSLFASLVHNHVWRRTAITPAADSCCVARSVPTYRHTRPSGSQLACSSA